VLAAGCHLLFAEIATFQYISVFAQIGTAQIRFNPCYGDKSTASGGSLGLANPPSPALGRWLRRDRAHSAPSTSTMAGGNAVTKCIAKAEHKKVISATTSYLLPYLYIYTYTYTLTLPADKPWDVVSVTRRSSGVAPRACVRVYARVLVPLNLYIHIYIHTHTYIALFGETETRLNLNPKSSGHSSISKNRKTLR